MHSYKFGAHACVWREWIAARLVDGMAVDQVYSSCAIHACSCTSHACSCAYQLHKP